LDTHIETVHNCEHCGISYLNLRQHVCDRIGQRGGHVGPGPAQVNYSFFKPIIRAHRGVVEDYKYTVPDDVVFTDEDKFFKHIHDPLARLLKEHIRFWHGINVIFRQLTELEDIKTGERRWKYLGTNSITIRHENFINECIQFMVDFILMQLDIYNSNGSGHKITAIQEAIVTIGQSKPIRGRGYLPIPECLKRRKGLLNIKGEDGLCFKYCVVASFHKKQVEKIKTIIRRLDKLPIKGAAHRMAIHRELQLGLNYEKYFDEYNWDGLSFPIALEDITIFEENNGISVNCYKNVEQI